MPTGIYKRIKSKKYGATGKHWKVKNTSKMKGCKNALNSIRTEASKQKNSEWHIKHPTFKNHLKNCQCSFCKAKRGETKSKNNPFFGCRHTEERKKEWKKLKKNKPRSGDPKKWRDWKHSEKSKIKISKNTASNRIDVKQKNKEWHLNNPNRKFSGTIIELKIEKELKKRGFKKNKDFYCNKNISNISNVDFYFPEHRIVIECDGCYYHNCLIHFPNFHKETREADERKTKLLTENGYKVHRFWEHEINESPEKCLNEINFFKNNE